MLWLLRFIMGYLIIKIDRENSEKILNRAAAQKIKIWNLRYKDGSIYGNISPKNFLKLYKVSRGINCKINIIKKIGLFFYIKKQRNIVGMVIGILIFSFILFYLSNFVWIINVEGNDIIPTSEIMQSCEKIGIYEGIRKSKIGNKFDAQRLALIQDGIAWCSLNTEGCVLNVNISEIVSFANDEDKEPSNLKSLEEGKIKKINVTSGDVMIKVGDVVSKGELLVSGVTQNSSGTHFVHSNGEIIAYTNRVFSAQGDFTQNKCVETGQKIVDYSIEFFEIKIPLFLGSVKDSYNYSCETFRLKFMHKNIPIKISREEYRFTENINVKYNEDVLIDNLYKEIQKQINEFDFISITETNREIIKNHKGILMKITYDCEENIALKEKILFSK